MCQITPRSNSSNLLNAFFLFGLFLQGDLFLSSSTTIIFTDVADAPVALTVISTSAFLFSKEFSVLKYINTLIIIFLSPVVRVLPFIVHLPDLKDSKTLRTRFYSYLENVVRNLNCLQSVIIMVSIEI